MVASLAFVTALFLLLSACPSAQKLPGPSDVMASPVLSDERAEGAEPGQGRRLVMIGVRGGLTLGAAVGQIDVFRQFDVVAALTLPWSWYSRSGWGVGTRFLTSAGALQLRSDTAFIGTAAYSVVVGSRDGRWAIDVAGGGALLSQHRFGNHDIGGAVQIVGAAGVHVPLYRDLGLGYRFHHFSDAGLYGPGTRGVDSHLLEIAYRVPPR